MGRDASQRWTVQRILAVCADFLVGKGIESPRLNAEVLLAHALRVDRVELYLRFDQPLTPQEVREYRGLIQRRLRREPLHYITGIREFWSLDFQVDPRVLIPRPETEILVEEAVRIARGMERGASSPIRILDVGTGSGAIAVAVAAELPGAEVWATDVSAEALEVAGANAAVHGLAQRIVREQGDLLEPAASYALPMDLVLTNPPYIPTDQFSGLSPEVRDYEPRGALDGGRGGMRCIDQIIDRAPAVLAPGGWLLVEMAPFQTRIALDRIQNTGAYRQWDRIRDYADRYRVVKAQAR